MPVLIVGRTEIPYQVRWSDAAQRRRIVVTPEKVEVVAPTGSGEAGLTRFVERKRRWIYDKLESVREAAAAVEDPRPTRYATGAKVLYRGRRLRLLVTRRRGATLEVAYQGGFQVTAPPEAEDEAIRQALESWMKRMVRRDIEEMVRRHAPALGTLPKAIRVRAMRDMWGSCGAGGVLHFDWRLAQAPRAVLEYAVVHELVHLAVRGHGPAFWRRVAAMVPGYQHEKAWLERHGKALG